jgi:RNA polymerase sigma factor (sigma-70 family)
LRCSIRKISWEINEASFKTLLLLFDGDLEAAAQKYELMREKLIRYFECQSCPLASDLTDETFNRVARRVEEGTEINPASLSAYFYSVARKIFNEYLLNIKKRGATIDPEDFENHPGDDPVVLSQNFSERIENERLLDCLDSCLQELPADDRRLIASYYQGEAGKKIDNRKQLANRYQLSIGNLRIRAFRIRERLEKCVKGCEAKFATE